jgi:hypothetical protein
MTLALVVFLVYLVVGLAVLFWFDCWHGWPDRGQAMPLDSCGCALLFFPSFLLYLLLGFIWDGLTQLWRLLRGE